MDTNDARLFLRIAETLSFKEGARLMSVSRSSASKRIALMEKELGTVLLHRSPRSLSLTDAGQVFLDYCRALCETMDEAQTALMNENQEARGLLRFSVSQALGDLLVPWIASEFSSDYPLIDLHARIGDPELDATGSGYDVVLKIASRLPDSRLKSRRIASTRLVLAASPKYLSRRGTPSHVRDLTSPSHRCIGVITGKKAMSTWNFAGEDGPHSVSIMYAFRTNSDAAAIAAARGGSGLVYMPYLLIKQELERSRLVTVLPEFSAHAHCGIYALYPPGKPPSKVAVFITFIQEKLAQLGTA